MSKLSALEKTLWRINDDRKVDSSSIIEKLKSELQQHHVNMYNAWEESGFDINSNSFDGSNLLCLASVSGCVKVVEFLIEKGVDVNVRDNEGKTPLHLAVIIPGQNTYIAKVLLNKGAEVNIQASNRQNLSNQKETHKFKFLVIFKYSCRGSASAVMIDIFNGA